MLDISLWTLRRAIQYSEFSVEEEGVDRETCRVLEDVGAVSEDGGADADHCTSLETVDAGTDQFNTSTGDAAGGDFLVEWCLNRREKMDGDKNEVPSESSWVRNVERY